MPTAISHAQLPGDLVALAQGGCGVSIASGDDNGAPVVGLGVGCRIMPGSVVRVLLGQAANAAVLLAVELQRPVAVTFTATRDHSSFQVKASHARICPACSDDLPEMDRQSVLFQDGLVEIGYSRVQAAGYCAYDPADLVALELTPERVFTQTPGPGAGAELPR
ncbi:hypothetical protein [Tropicimonas sediminicola]|uniref:Uncharacterized protein n=1 Tax=Tropicimonas sediminicola TaxID=1031541 RepID=A0A239LB59_9RHOB|nr:hypothetical protein [Tropicimonas sediminicola]SNT27138.1 hypothetical protein SAMN05421757_10965 [Tropicimonas sediminicola]